MAGPHQAHRDAVGDGPLFMERKRTEQVERENSPSESDRIELSVRGREIQQLDQLIQSAPDIRQDKVDAIRSAIEAGTYNVKAEKIADKIIGGGLIDSIF